MPRKIHILFHIQKSIVLLPTLTNLQDPHPISHQEVFQRCLTPPIHTNPLFQQSKHSFLPNFPLLGPFARNRTIREVALHLLVPELRFQLPMILFLARSVAKKVSLHVCSVEYKFRIHNFCRYTLRSKLIRVDFFTLVLLLYLKRTLLTSHFSKRVQYLLTSNFSSWCITIEHTPLDHSISYPEDQLKRTNSNSFTRQTWLPCLTNAHKSLFGMVPLRSGI